MPTMSNYILRRRRLGKTSCREIASKMASAISVVLSPKIESDWLIRWGTTSTFPSKHVLNTAAAISWCADKRASRLEMQAKGVPVPETFDYDPDWFEGNEFLEQTPEEQAERFVARPSRHSQGRNLFVGSRNDCQATLARWGGGYMSRLIDKEAEYRVAVVQGRVAWVARKTPGNPQDVAWNVARGGRFDNMPWSTWPLKVVKAAIEAFEVSGLDFGGVDIMVKGGDVYVLEINSAPSQTSPYRQSCMAKCFDWIIANNSKEHFTLSNRRGGWRKFIHPALSEEAW